MKKIMIIILALLLIFPSLMSIHADTSISFDVGDTGITVAGSKENNEIAPSQEIEVKCRFNNSSTKEQRIYIEVLSDESLLAENMNLSVNYKNREILNKKIKELEKTIELGNFKPNENDELMMKISLDTDADNSYTMQNAKIKIRLLTQEEYQEEVKTGDTTDINNWLWLCVGSLCLFFIILYRKKGDAYE